MNKASFFAGLGGGAPPEAFRSDWKERRNGAVSESAEDPTCLFLNEAEGQAGSPHFILLPQGKRILKTF